MMNRGTCLAFLIAVLLLVSASLAELEDGEVEVRELEVGFYRKTCPTAESVVRRVVFKAVDSNPGLGAGLIRLLFHDCFVRGCDGSVLIAPTPSHPSERSSLINLSLRGFDVIDQAKAQLESTCPETVSCADIVAFAARDSALKLGGITYPVAAGRRDGFVSDEADPPQNLPLFTFNLTQLENRFASKGLTLHDMVVLSGAHSIGIAHCSSIINRLYPTIDPTLNSTFAATLLSLCPNDTSSNNPTTPLDYQTPNVLDNKYYEDVLNGKVLLTSDEDLANSSDTLGLVQSLSAKGGGGWAAQFATAMQKMGQIGVLTGTDGNIRLNCSIFND